MDLLSRQLQKTNTAADPPPVTYDVLEHLSTLISVQLKLPLPATADSTKSDMELLKLLMDSLPVLSLRQDSRDNPRRYVKFFRCYFGLATRSHLSTLDVDLCTKIMSADVLNEVHERSLGMYQSLRKFAVDVNTRSKYFK